MVGKEAPSFTAKAVINESEIVEDFSLDQFIGEKFVVCLFYPLDSPFVYPKELMALQEQIDEFISSKVLNYY